MDTALKVMSPAGTPTVMATSMAPRLDTLENKTIGMIWNGEFRGEIIFPTIEKLLRVRYAGVKVIQYNEFPLTQIAAFGPEMRSEMLEAVSLALTENACDAVITGMAAWGTCTPAAVRPAMVAEKAGIPSVTITATSFLDLVHLLGESEGFPEQRAAEYPGTLSVESDAVIKEKIAKVTFSQIVEGLTKARGRSGKGQDELYSDESSLTGTLDEINEIFRKRKFTDGLAIIPPTRKRIEEFLKYTNRRPDEEIAVLQPGNLRATPLNIAANGVMAGCRPEHMPILIAAVEAIADPHYNLAQLGTTGGINPYLLINGPAIKQLGVKYDIGLTSRGPNPAIGRALGLIVRNIANFKPGDQYMGTFGYILPFILAEDEEHSPWEPFHVENGFDKNVSTVTAGATMNWGFYGYPTGTNPEAHLKIICREIVRNLDQYAPIMFGRRQMMMILLTPNVAEVIARGGYSKEDVKKYLFENSRVTIEEINFLLKYGYAGGGAETIQSLIERGSFIPREWAKLGPNDRVPVLGYPGVIHVAVCGDHTRNKVLALHSAYITPTTKIVNMENSVCK